MKMPLELVQTGVDVPVSQISETGSPQKVRHETADTALEELANSIKKHGQVHAISLLEPNGGGKYEVANGMRRSLAARTYGIPMLRANVYRIPAGQESNRELLIQEHLYAANMAEPLLPIERARMFDAVMREFDFSVEQVAEVFGETADDVRDTLRYLSIDDQVLDIIAANPNKFTEAHINLMVDYASPAKRSWRMKPEEQVRVARYLADQTDKRVASDPRKLEKHIRSVVNERRDQERVKNAQTRRQSDPVKALLKGIEGVELAVRALKAIDLNAIKAIEPADKGFAIKHTFDAVTELTTFADESLGKLTVRKATS
jgi:ParB/RepB/Spo0J family partition protein